MNKMELKQNTRENKEYLQYVRMDSTMIKRLDHLKKKSGISKSELIREAVRRLLNDYEKNNITIIP